MARFYAQIFTLVLLVAGIAGLFLGDAGSVDRTGRAGGNLGGLTLHLTWWRDGFDLALAGLYAWVGFAASRHAGRLAVIAAGAVLLVLAVAGFIIGDDDAATKGVLGMHFPAAVNVLDLAVGGLGVLAGLGTLEGPEPSVSRRR